MRREMPDPRSHRVAGSQETDRERAAALRTTIALEDTAHMFAAFRDTLLTGKGERYKNIATTGLANARPDLLDHLGYR